MSRCLVVCAPVDVVGVSVVFFFFQAEDGIRDWSVTGVQTCALPISLSRTCATRVPCLCTSRRRIRTAGRADGNGGGAPKGGCPPRRGFPHCHNRLDRSEERRVGKECGSRWEAVYER